MCPALPGADRQLTRPFVDRAHGFGCVEDQVQDDLLQLNTIPLNGSQPVRQAGLDRDSSPDDHASRQPNRLFGRFIQIKTMLSRRRFPDVSPDTIDDVSGPVGVAYDTAERFPDFAEVRRLPVHEIQGRADVIARAGDRLRDFVSQRGGQSPHYAQADHVGLTPSQRRRAIDFIAVNLCENFRMAELAQASGLNEAAMLRAFKLTFGVSPYQYVLARRVERASDLIRTTNVSLAEIACGAGFGDQSHMTRLVKRATRQTPKALRHG
jgi:AraC-like DNA-binding protein